MFDILILNATVIDGTGKDSFLADVAILDEKIAAIGELKSYDSKRVIDARGCVLCPGFIDPHSHAEVTMMLWPENEGNILQGVTTFIGGNCGFSLAPVSNISTLMIGYTELFPELKHNYYSEMSGPNVSSNELAKRAKEKLNIDMNFRTMNEFCEKIEEQTFSQNFYPLVPHGNIRSVAMNDDCNRAATEEEIEKMKAVLGDELRNGMRGMSTGLDYPPGAFATHEELLKLSVVLKEHNSIYSSHVRARRLFTTGEGGFLLEEGVKEALHIAENGVRINISHLTVMDSIEKTKGIFEKAEKEGLDFSFDVISNTTGGGYTMVQLISIFRPWYMTAGSIEQFSRNLEDIDYTLSMKKDMSNSKWFYANNTAFPGVENAILISLCKEKTYENKTISQLMNEYNLEYADALIMVIKADPLTEMKYGNPENKEQFAELKKFMELPWSMPCSDGMSANMDSVFAKEIPMVKYPHQNNFCYMIKYLKCFSPDRLEEAIKKATGYVAERFMIEDRGVIKEGAFADLVIMNLDELETNESPIDTRRAPLGIKYVFVNGVVTAENGKHTGEKNGKVLRKNQIILKNK